MLRKVQHLFLRHLLLPCNISNVRRLQRTTSAPVRKLQMYLPPLRGGH
ncbi:RepA leader peptide Tap [Salmonella enterica]|nr:RepA leader peptide Tap [Salmonella enterica]